jgi:hypothetical protein
MKTSREKLQDIIIVANEFPATVDGLTVTFESRGDLLRAIKKMNGFYAPFDPEVQVQLAFRSGKVSEAAFTRAQEAGLRISWMPGTTPAEIGEDMVREFNRTGRVLQEFWNSASVEAKILGKPDPNGGYGQ